MVEGICGRGLGTSSGHREVWIGVPVRCYMECNISRTINYSTIGLKQDNQLQPPSCWATSNREILSGANHTRIEFKWSKLLKKEVKWSKSHLRRETGQTVLLVKIR